MGMLTHLKLLSSGILSSILPFLSYKGDVNTQIALYKKMRSREPEIPEDELLNVLLVSRLESLPKIASKKQEYRHYESLLRSSKKTLKDIIWSIIEYEYILSREEHLYGQLASIGLSKKEILANIETFEANGKRYIEQRIRAMGTSKEQTKWFVLALLTFVFISIIAVQVGPDSSEATSRIDAIDSDSSEAVSRIDAIDSDSSEAISRIDAIDSDSSEGTHRIDATESGFTKGTPLIEAIGISGSGEPCIIVEGKLAYEGDIINGFRILKIYPDRVEFEKNGKMVVGK
jgi:hypothetical protein